LAVNEIMTEDKYGCHGGHLENIVIATSLNGNWYCTRKDLFHVEFFSHY